MRNARFYLGSAPIEHRRLRSGPQSEFIRTALSLLFALDKVAPALASRNFDYRRPPPRAPPPAGCCLCCNCCVCCVCLCCICCVCCWCCCSTCWVLAGAAFCLVSC